MANLTLRNVKGVGLTNTELDNNFISLNTELGGHIGSNGTSHGVATTATAGFMSATDKTKLDGLSSYNLPTASTTTLGGVKIDGTTITITNGVISGSSSYSLPTATDTILGGVKVDSTTLTNNSGTISLTQAKLKSVLGTLSIADGGTGATSAGQALTNLLPTGTTNGYVLTTGGPGTFYWAAASGGGGGSQGTSINSTRTTITATANQTVVTGFGTYTPGTNQLRVYIDNSRQWNSDYTETNTTSFTLNTPLAAGQVIQVEIDGYTTYTQLASATTCTPVGNISATTVQNAIAELDTEKVPLNGTGATGTWGISVTGGAGSVAWGNVTGKPTNVSAFTNDAGYLTSVSNSVLGSGTADSTTYLRGDRTWVSIPSGGVGQGQTLVSFTIGTQRVNGTTYYNTTGKPIIVIVTGSDAVNQYWSMIGTAGGSRRMGVAGASPVGSALRYTHSMLVMDGESYSVSWNSAATMTEWSEIR